MLQNNMTWDLDPWGEIVYFHDMVQFDSMHIIW